MHLFYCVCVFFWCIEDIICKKCAEWKTSRCVEWFENRVLREIFGPKRDMVRREWRRLHKEELYALNPHQVIFG
jgi:hypothetical protein